MKYGAVRPVSGAPINKFYDSNGFESGSWIFAVVRPLSRINLTFTWNRSARYQPISVLAPPKCVVADLGRIGGNDLARCGLQVLRLGKVRGGPLIGEFHAEFQILEGILEATSDCALVQAFRRLCIGAWRERGVTATTRSGQWFIRASVGACNSRSARTSARRLRAGPSGSDGDHRAMIDKLNYVAAPMDIRAGRRVRTGSVESEGEGRAGAAMLCRCRAKSAAIAFGLADATDSARCRHEIKTHDFATDAGLRRGRRDGSRATRRYSEAPRGDRIARGRTSPAHCFRAASAQRR